MGEREEVFELPELHDDLKHTILVWLTVECICRFRSVCKEWNALLSSAKFIRKWGEAPSNSMPWLVLQNARSKMPNCLLYCFFTQKWRLSSSISLSFLKEKEIQTAFHGSAAGLFLVGNFPRFVVANPLTRTSIKLPPMSSIWSIRSIGIIEGEDDSRETYKVVALGQPRDQKGDIVEIYDSTDRSWRIAGHMPEDLWVVRAHMGMELLFCDGVFYCLTIINGWWGIMGFNIRNGSSFSAPLPELAKKKHIFPHLLTCGSRVLVTGGKVNDGRSRVLVTGGKVNDGRSRVLVTGGKVNDGRSRVLVTGGKVNDGRSRVLVTGGKVNDGEGLLQEAIIWEFEKVKADSPFSSSSCWKEVARMPPSLCEDVNRTLYGIDSSMDCPFMGCIGVGDRACFILNGCMKVMEVVFYSLSEKTWSRLPSCPLDNEGYVRVMAFGPRPDMKVG